MDVIKIVMLGDTGVGKTSLRNRYLHNKFSESHKSTIGCDFITKEVINNKGKAISLQIWDTAGQERFHSLGTSYYRGSDVLILVYSMTDPQSFKNLKSWIKLFFKNLKVTKIEEVLNFPIILIGNKIDLESEQIVLKKDAQKFSKEILKEIFLKEGEGGLVKMKNMKTLKKKSSLATILNFDLRNVKKKFSLNSFKAEHEDNELKNFNDTSQKISPCKKVVMTKYDGTLNFLEKWSYTDKIEENNNKFLKHTISNTSMSEVSSIYGTAVEGDNSLLSNSSTGTGGDEVNPSCRTPQKKNIYIQTPDSSTLGKSTLPKEVSFNSFLNIKDNNGQESLVEFPTFLEFPEIPFFEASAKSGRRIDDVFEYIANVVNVDSTSGTFSEAINDTIFLENSSEKQSKINTCYC
ncbi:hypothetical protein HDU92_002036 [Lobulomyces angularis]|nr:hypothetical protein HDU92_002036 [Lobulomyces angularis]